jgi:hypothetical protein
MDIVIVSANTNNGGVFLGIGNGTFMPEIIFSTGYALISTERKFSKFLGNLPKSPRNKLQ